MRPMQILLAVVAVLAIALFVPQAEAGPVRRAAGALKCGAGKVRAAVRAPFERVRARRAARGC